MAPSATQNDIDEFLSQKRIALIGVSRDAKQFSRRLFEQFRRRDYALTLVHPEADSIDGIACVKSVSAVEGGVDGALLILPRDALRQALDDCLRAGVKRIWIYGTRGDKDIDAAHIALARSDGAAVIAGQCPLMFFSDAGLVHRFHGWTQKLFGTYPGL